MNKACIDQYINEDSVEFKLRDWSFKDKLLFIYAILFDKRIVFGAAINIYRLKTKITEH